MYQECAYFILFLLMLVFRVVGRQVTRKTVRFTGEGKFLLYSSGSEKALELLHSFLSLLFWSPLYSSPIQGEIIKVRLGI